VLDRIVVLNTTSPSSSYGTTIFVWPHSDFVVTDAYVGGSDTNAYNALRSQLVANLYRVVFNSSAIYLGPSIDLMLSGCVVANSPAANAPAIYNADSNVTMLIYDSTISDVDGDAIYSGPTTRVSLFNTSVTRNSGTGVNLEGTYDDTPYTLADATLTVDTKSGFSSNGHDMSVDGTNYTSITQLRGATNKVITSANGHNNKLIAE
jgi:hypothetical protein